MKPMSAGMAAEYAAAYVAQSAAPAERVLEYVEGLGLAPHDASTALALAVQHGRVHIDWLWRVHAGPDPQART